jgi:hypothetical protein
VIKRVAKAKGKGGKGRNWLPRKAKGSHMAYLADLTPDDGYSTSIYKAKAKGGRKGKSSGKGYGRSPDQKNPIGADGEHLKCFGCGSDMHLNGHPSCPNRDAKGKGKGKSKFAAPAWPEDWQVGKGSGDMQAWITTPAASYLGSDVCGVIPGPPHDRLNPIQNHASSHQQRPAEEGWHIGGDAGPLADRHMAFPIMPADQVLNLNAYTPLSTPDPTFEVDLLRRSLNEVQRLAAEQMFETRAQEENARRRDQEMMHLEAQRMQQRLMNFEGEEAHRFHQNMLELQQERTSMTF